MTGANREKLRRLVEQDMAAYNTGNVENLDELYVEDWVDHSQGIRGIEALKRGIVELRTAFPDVSLALEDLVVEGDRVAARATMKGTHSGEYLGIRPTGRSVEVTAFEISRTRDGKYAETWGMLDVFSLLNQLGVQEMPRGI